MTGRSITIRSAETDADFAMVRTLCDEFYQWLKVRYASVAWIVETYYPEHAWQQLMAELPLIHARPGGDIWLALSGDEPVGTIMLKGFPEDGTCEMKRLMVRSTARGSGVGRSLVDCLVCAAWSRGYRRLLFDAGAAHHEALRLYRSLGFVERGPYYEVAADLASMLVFFEGDLGELVAAR
jgi:GNAT superfamily N-acetyltransferase